MENKSLFSIFVLSLILVAGCDEITQNNYPNPIENNNECIEESKSMIVERNISVSYPYEYKGFMHNSEIGWVENIELLDYSLINLYKTKECLKERDDITYFDNCDIKLNQKEINEIDPKLNSRLDGHDDPILYVGGYYGGYDYIFEYYVKVNLSKTEEVCI